jgi:uncharacterized protein
MKDVQYITNRKGKILAAIVPIDIWKSIPGKHKQNTAEDDDVKPPKIAKRKHPFYIVQESPIHGRGVFATRDIKKGQAVIEYKGQYISQDEANDRYGEDDGQHHHTVLFTIDDDTVIDANKKGNDARYINHSCDPNCEAVQYGRRICIEAIRNIPEGQELTYDYHLQVDKPHTKKKMMQYACHCGSKNCRGTQVDVE